MVAGVRRVDTSTVNIGYWINQYTLNNSIGLARAEVLLCSCSVQGVLMYLAFCRLPSPIPCFIVYRLRFSIVLPVQCDGDWGRIFSGRQGT